MTYLRTQLVMLFVIITQLWTVPHVHYAVYNSYTTAVDCLSHCGHAPHIIWRLIIMSSDSSGLLTTTDTLYSAASAILECKSADLSLLLSSYKYAIIMF